nr:MAG TPA: hypothetical protein [Caudoviricetes sp.]
MWFLFLNKQKRTHYKNTFLACSTEVVNLCQFSYELLVFSYKHRLFHHLTFVRATRFGSLNPTLLTGDSR